MCRRGLMFGLAALVGTVLPLPALADGSGAQTRPRQEARAAAAEEIPFTLGGVPCSLIPVPAAEDSAPVGTGTCPGVRPGGRVLSSVGDCTFNFLFRAPDGTRYIGTAGHCVSPGAASNEESNPDGNGRIERVWSEGGGPVAKDPEGHRIGEFAYAVVQPSKDFALIRIDPAVESSPEMCHFGAPRGVFTTNTTAAVVLHYYGSGIAVGTVLPARSAVALGTPNPDHVFAAGLAVPGDSGSGVMTVDGLALGVLVSFGVHGFRYDRGPLPHTPSPRDPPDADGNGVDLGTLGITRLGPQLARASQMLGVPLELFTER
jgi:hypothetical protein